MAEIRAEVNIKGIPAAMLLLNSIPGRLVGPTVKGSLDELLEEGISLMTMHISELVDSEKSTGQLAGSVEGFQEAEIDTAGFTTSGFESDDLSGSAKIIIGSAVPYAEYAAREIGWSKIERYVLLQTGRWVWIENRPPIPAHPFLEYTLYDMLNIVMPRALGANFLETSAKIQSNIDALQRTESLGVTGPE